MPKKTLGINYFPFDVDFFSDINIKVLRAKYGNDGVMIYIYLLTVIYREGYYIEYTDDLVFIIADELGISSGTVQQVLTFLCKRSLLKELKSTDAVVGSFAAMSGGYLFTESTYGRYSVSTYVRFDKTIGDNRAYSVRIDKISDFVLAPFAVVAGNTYTVGGTLDIPKFVTVTVTVSYISGAETPPSQTIFTLRDGLNYQIMLYAVRENNKLFLRNDNNVLATFTIPKRSTTACLSVSATSATLSTDNGEETVALDSSVFTQTAIGAITLQGEQLCDWVYVADGTATIRYSFYPDWESGTKFMTHFYASSLQAGQLGTAETAVDVYRENVATGELKKLYSCGVDENAIRDYSWITGEKYNYYGYVRLDNRYTSANKFNGDTAICRRQPFYLLLECVADTEQPNAYHVKRFWRFGNNISAGSVSNNNAPNFLSNFTGYRLKQLTARKGRSGTLSALISNVKDFAYKDTVKQMEELYALSESENTLFLKDMKGNLYMVAVSGAITQTINTKSALQEVTVSIPWEEVGNADGVSIVQLQSDENWVDDHELLSEVELSVNAETGELRVDYPDGYDFNTTFALERPDLYAKTKTGVAVPQLALENGEVVLNGTRVENVRRK